MRALNRNKIRIFYANYRDKVPIRDEYGNLTGEYRISYDNPIAIMANVSAARGEATTRQFGDEESYDRVIVLDFVDATTISRNAIAFSDDGEGNVSIASNNIDLEDDGAGNITLTTRDLPVVAGETAVGLASGMPKQCVTKFPITATSILWIDTLPEIAEDGSTETPHDYIVKQVATSLNSVSIAVSKVNVRG